MEIEQRILGIEEEKKPESRVKANYFADHCVWEVTSKASGKVRFNGVMVREMLDANSKALVMNGRKEVEYNGFKFKVVR